MCWRVSAEGANRKKENNGHQSAHDGKRRNANGRGSALDARRVDIASDEHGVRAAVVARCIVDAARTAAPRGGVSGVVLEHSDGQQSAGVIVVVCEHGGRVELVVRRAAGVVPGVDVVPAERGELGVDGGVVARQHIVTVPAADALDAHKRAARVARNGPLGVGAAHLHALQPAVRVVEGAAKPHEEAHARFDKLHGGVEQVPVRDVPAPVLAAKPLEPAHEDGARGHPAVCVPCSGMHEGVWETVGPQVARFVGARERTPIRVRVLRPQVCQEEQLESSPRKASPRQTGTMRLTDPFFFFFFIFKSLGGELVFG